jgi:hypothetical protein
LVAKVFVQPFPKRAVGPTFTLVVDPRRDVGLESVFVWFERDVLGDASFADGSAFFLNDDFVALHKVFSLGDEAPDGARRHEYDHEHAYDDMEPFA